MVDCAQHCAMRLPQSEAKCFFFSSSVASPLLLPFRETILCFFRLLRRAHLMMLRCCESTLLGVARSVPVLPAEGADLCLLRRWVPEGECFLWNDPNLSPCLVVGRLHAEQDKAARTGLERVLGAKPKKQPTLQSCVPRTTLYQECTTVFLRYDPSLDRGMMGNSSSSQWGAWLPLEKIAPCAAHPPPPPLPRPASQGSAGARHGVIGASTLRLVPRPRIHHIHRRGRPKQLENSTQRIHRHGKAESRELS